jgi:hypothetical protein
MGFNNIYCCGFLKAKSDNHEKNLLHPYLYNLNQDVDCKYANMGKWIKN